MALKQNIIIGTILTAIIAFIGTYFGALNGITKFESQVFPALNTSAPIVESSITSSAFIIASVPFILILFVGAVIYIKFS